MDNVYGAITEVSYYSKTTGTERKCNIYTPPNYTPDKTYPVLYLLHGIGGTHREWLDGAPDEILGNLITAGEVPPMIAVLPNVRAMADDSVPSEVLSQQNIDAFDNFINDLQNDLMPYIKAHYPVSEKREETAIAGLSMGGREALYIGITMPETFGFIGAFSPAPGLMPYAALDYPGQLNKEQMLLPDEYKHNTLIFICNGNRDDIVNDLPFQYKEALVKNGMDVVYDIFDGEHDFTVWKEGLYYFVRCIF